MRRLKIRLPPGKRRGFSLFEVLVALAIFAFSIAAIGQLISSGMRGAVHSRLQTEAMFLCESKLAEVVSGIAPLQAVRETPFPDDSEWNYAIEMQAGPQPDLYVVMVTVKHLSSSTAGALSYSLSRVVRDPDAILLMEQEKAQLLQQYQATQSTSGTTSSSSPAGGTGGSR